MLPCTRQSWMLCGIMNIHIERLFASVLLPPPLSSIVCYYHYQYSVTIIITKIVILLLLLLFLLFVLQQQLRLSGLKDGLSPKFNSHHLCDSLTVRGNTAVWRCCLCTIMSSFRSYSKHLPSAVTCWYCVQIILHFFSHAVMLQRTSRA